MIERRREDHVSDPIDYTSAAVRAMREAVAAERDFPGWLSAVLSEVAREEGGSYGLITGRPGSWEASHVQALASPGDL